MSRLSMAYIQREQIQWAAEHNPDSWYWENLANYSLNQCPEEWVNENWEELKLLTWKEIYEKSKEKRNAQ